jgi:hypothetical protein
LSQNGLSFSLINRYNKKTKENVNQSGFDAILIKLMDDTQNIPLIEPPDESAAQAPAAMPVRDPEAERKAQIRNLKIIGIGTAVLIVVIAILAFLFTRSAAETTRLRDIFIIFMALESLVIGVALTILMVQLAILINLLQNEIKPILYSTNETVNTLRGTASFLSDNLSEPIIKLNEYMAGFKKLLDLLRLGR